MFSSFCPDQLWNVTLTWETTDPRFTQCFKDTVLTTGPTLALLITLPMWFLDNRHKWREQQNVIEGNFSFLFKVKCVLGVALIIQSILEFTKRWYINTSLYPSDYVGTATPLLTNLIVIAVLYNNAQLCKPTSKCLTMYWSLNLILSLPIFIDTVSVVSSALPKSLSYLTMILGYPLIAFQFLVHCWADVSPRYTSSAPESKSSAFSSMFFAWLDPLIWRGFRKNLVFQELPPMPNELYAKGCASEVMNRWNSSLQKNNIELNEARNGVSIKHEKRVKLWKTLVATFGAEYALISVIGVAHYVIVFIAPQLLKPVIRFIQDDSEEEWKGYLYISMMVVAQFASTITFHVYLQKVFSITFRARSAILSMIYRKALKLSNTARRRFTIGEITNFMSVDCQRVLDGLPMVNQVWSSPMSLVLAMILLYRELGPSSFAGVAVLAVITPLNMLGTKKGQALMEKQMEYRDMRMKQMNEILPGIKVLKLYAWENPFVDKVKDFRATEITLMQLAYKIFILCCNFVFSCAAFFVAAAVFGIYTIVNPDEPLTAEKIFVSITLFGLIRVPLIMLPFAIIDMVKMIVSLRRIDQFLKASELDGESVQRHTVDPKNAVEVDEASFSWTSDKMSLSDVSCKVRKGSLVAVVGMVGSGKSSFLSAILGDMRRCSGTVCVEGSVAYVPQQAWIQNLTVKDNILFGSEYEDGFYSEVVNACALNDDLAMLSAGDNTEIGENGINLSGGQKQRISLARSVYSKADIYLLDDPLSAVDAHVGQHIFNHVIDSQTGVLRDKTRILVTHNVQVLKHVDYILIMKEGRLSAQGTYQSLVLNNSDFSAFLDQYEVTTKSSDLKTTPAIEDKSKTDTKPLKKHGDEEEEEGRLVSEEEAQVGKVDKKVYIEYAKNIGLVKSLLILVLCMVCKGFMATSDVWLSRWADLSAVNETAAINQASTYIAVYGGLGLTAAVIDLAKEFMLLLSAITASKQIHDNLLSKIIKSPMSFFDTNPNGRILNRFSGDINTLDEEIPYELSDFLFCLMETLAVVVIICYSTPYFVIALIPLTVAYILIQKYYVTTARQLKRLDSINRSPIFSHFTEVVNGAASVRAYKQESRFIQENINKVDKSVCCGYLNISSNRWLGTRTESLGNLIILFAGLFAIWSRGTISAGLAGLSISYAITVLDAMNWMVRMMCQLETNFVALERIMEYTNNKQEDSWNKDVDRTLEKWPSHGAIDFIDYSTRYREGLDLVLKDINMSVKSGEKVGICGRTGAGKSSLTLSLFRIVEATHGKIVIDNTDISEIGLHKLRSCLTIIPQDPVLFGGTLRFNLDPCDQHSDAEIWNALGQSHLREHLKNVNNGLDHIISEGGENFSVGQRQLICLARAILRKTKVLILDEATAAVDLETDKLVQETIRSKFNDCTVLTIAHRINTIMNYDKIAVFDTGRLVEMDSPKNLLNRQDSIFKSLVTDAGLG